MDEIVTMVDAFYDYAWLGDVVEDAHYDPTNIEPQEEKQWQYSPQENIAICPQCGYEHYLGTYHQYATNFCPNCGTRMKPIK